MNSVPRKEARADKRPAPRSSGMAIWLPMVIVAVVGLPITLAAAVMSTPRTTRAQNFRQQAFVVVAEAAVDPPAAPLVPLAAANNIAENEPDAAAVAACNDACRPRADADLFGTAVSFVRNPDEAARFAREERKLTFILHVSGNFDDPGFT